jgi:hypothetical protein
MALYFLDICNVYATAKVDVFVYFHSRAVSVRRLLVASLRNSIALHNLCQNYLKRTNYRYKKVRLNFIEADHLKEKFPK